MNLSNSGKVVIIDDDLEKDAKPLMDILGKFQIPYLYYDGKEESLPHEPHVGIRFVFLDIELVKTSGSDRNKQMASTAIEVLKKIISKDNGPYFIIFWSKHCEAIDFILENCKTANIYPINYLVIEKSECMDKNREYDLSIISDKIKEKIATIDAFQLYVEWENLVNSSSKQFVNNISTLIPKGDNWSRDTSILFYKMYKTFVDKNEHDDNLDKFKCSCHLLNRSFLSKLEESTKSELHLPESFNFQNGDLDSQTIAKLNTSLFLRDNIIDKPMPGNIYKCSEDNDFLNILVNRLYNNGEKPNDFELCQVLITPECDIAQRKNLQVKSEDKELVNVHRIIIGIIFTYLDGFDKNNFKGDFKFRVGPFWQEDKIKCIIFDFATLSIIDESKFNFPPICCVKQNILSDLQSKASNHVNRLGNYQLMI